MKTNIKSSLILELNEEELYYLCKLTQNCLEPNPEEESLDNKAIRTDLFVACSRALGYEVDSLGNILKMPRKD